MNITVEVAADTYCGGTLEIVLSDLLDEHLAVHLWLRLHATNQLGVVVHVVYYVVTVGVVRV